MQANGGEPSRPPVPERPTPPVWLTPAALLHFERMVDEAIAANVPTRQCDADAFALAATYTVDLAKCRNAGKRARIGRDLMALHKVLGKNPEARIRMGLKGKAPAPTKTGKMLAMVRSGAAVPTEETESA